MDRVTLREFDQLCLPLVEPLAPDDIQQIRTSQKVSQAVFAAYLNTSVSSVQKWETGAKPPSGPALKLLRLVQKKGLDVLV